MSQTAKPPVQRGLTPGRTRLQTGGSTGAASLFSRNFYRIAELEGRVQLEGIQIGGAVDQSLQDLELQRKGLFRQLENLGDFRRGTISVNYRKCGKSNCVCAREDHPGRRKWKRQRKRWTDTTRLSACPKNQSRSTTGSVRCVRSGGSYAVSASCVISRSR